jgi:hypothetical protein
MCAGTLTILGEAGDTVDIVGSFTSHGQAGGFRIFTVGAAMLLIDADIPLTNVT